MSEYIVTYVCMPLYSLNSENQTRNELHVFDDDEGMCTLDFLLLILSGISDVVRGNEVAL